MNLGCVVELGEAGLELSLPASGHHKLGQDGDVRIRAPGIFNLCNFRFLICLFSKTAIDFLIGLFFWENSF